METPMDAVAETCIICLGDLPTDEFAGIDNETAKSSDDDAPVIRGRGRRQQSPIKSTELIANLRPCNHYLHDECIKQWIEKANSCPICRTVFNVIELTATLKGPVLDSYSVQDKQQVIDLDPTFLVGEEEVEIDVDEPCMVCGAVSEAETLLICDGCDHYSHIFCAGLDEVPEGSFICHNCRNEGEAPIDEGWDHSAEFTHQQPRRRGNRSLHVAEQGIPLAQRARNNRRRRENEQWASVWQAVLERTNIDLDFPFAQEQTTFRRGQRRSQQEAEQAAEDAWLRRLQIAEQQGAGNQFEETTRRLLPRPAPVESEENVRDWRAFDRAREAIADTDNPRRRKRKTRSPSPLPETASEPSRRFKRPRARLSSAAASPAAHPTAEASSSRLRDGPSTSRSIRDAPAEGVPTFLQSLLSEVEAGSANASPPSDYYSEPLPQRHNSISIVSSPGSPYSSHASPRSLSPQPTSPRPMSPLSRVASPTLPNGPPTFSPAVSMISSANHDSSAERGRPIMLNATSPLSPSSPSHSPTRIQRFSPSRTGLSYEQKADIQRFVSDALKLHYRRDIITKDEYTMINRDISRQLYDKISHDGGLNDDESRTRWRRAAKDEVDRAVFATAEARKRKESAKGKVSDAHDSTSSPAMPISAAS